MLLFIQVAANAVMVFKRFQYITCYSLSQFRRNGSNQKRKFQYITCYSLSRGRCILDRSGEVSIHHMLLFIGIRIHHICRSFRRFNTSHVTLYHDSSDDLSITFKFQYITCYSLSHYDVNSLYPAQLFQYITCYSLSKVFRFRL